MKIDILSLVLRKGKKRVFGHIFGPDCALWMKICQNDRGAQAFQHTKFDGHPCGHKIARAANVSDLLIAVESTPLEQLS